MDQSGNGDNTQEADEQPLPEIDFATFVMSLATSAMMHLGEGEDAQGPPAPPDFPLAKQTIDIIGMLREKTRGNLGPEEAQALDTLLYDLRMRYLEAKRKAGKG